MKLTPRIHYLFATSMLTLAAVGYHRLDTTDAAHPVVTPRIQEPSAQPEGGIQYAFLTLTGSAPDPAHPTPDASMMVPMTLFTARQAVAAAQAEALRLGGPISVAVVDAQGALILFERSELGAIDNPSLAWLRARHALAPSAISAQANDGAAPIRFGQSVIGAIGIVGMTREQEAHVASVGAEAARHVQRT